VYTYPAIGCDHKLHAAVEHRIPGEQSAERRLHGGIVLRADIEFAVDEQPVVDPPFDAPACGAGK
jgi:hypothetical protein